MSSQSEGLSGTLSWLPCSITSCSVLKMAAGGNRCRSLAGSNLLRAGKSVDVTLINFEVVDLSKIPLPDLKMKKERAKKISQAISFGASHQRLSNQKVISGPKISSLIVSQQAFCIIPSPLTMSEAGHHSLQFSQLFLSALQRMQGKLRFTKTDHKQ
jgi:hypothetical protein